jgi:hypothetical protein
VPLRGAVLRSLYSGALLFRCDAPPTNSPRLVLAFPFPSSPRLVPCPLPWFTQEAPNVRESGEEKACELICDGAAVGVAEAQQVSGTLWLTSTH